MLRNQKSKEIEALLDKYKELESREENSIYFIEGFLTFSRSYNEVPIKDTYYIQIEIPARYPKKLPLTREIGGRIPKIADNHINKDGSFCLGTELDTKMTFSKVNNLLGYVDELVIPFLYSFSYKEKYGEMPFGERSHGYAGVLEFYKDYFKTDSYLKAFKFLALLAGNIYKGFHKCPCGSNKLLKNCHGKYINKLESYKNRHNFKRDFENCYEMFTKYVGSK